MWKLPVDYAYHIGMHKRHSQTGLPVYVHSIATITLDHVIYDLDSN